MEKTFFIFNMIRTIYTPDIQLNDHHTIFYLIIYNKNKIILNKLVNDTAKYNKPN